MTARENAALTGRASVQAQRKGLSSPSSVQIWHRLRLRQLDGLFMEAGGGWCSTAIIVAPLLNEAPILATGRWHGPLKLVAFVQKLLSFTCELIQGSGCFAAVGFLLFMAAGIAAWRCCHRFAAAARLVVVSGDFHGWLA